jgi:RimJ/RimL family protein N-acetyltransferase
MLVGKHVRLRTVDLADAEYIRNLRNRPEIVSQFQHRHFINDEQQSAFMQSLLNSKEHLYFIAESLPKLTPFGVYFVRHIDHRNQRGENGVFLDPDRHETGVEAIEAAFLLLKYEFEYLNLEKIVAEVLAQNTRALRFNEALGMIREGVRRKHVFFDGEHHDLVLFALFRDDFFQHPTPLIRSFLKSQPSTTPS